jgi:hypothetical protein
MPDVKGFGLVGEHRYSTGAQAQFRAGPYGEQIITDAHGQLFEATRNGRIFHASTGLAIALNVASPLGAAGTAPFALFNPTTTMAAVIECATVNQLVGATPVLNFPVWNYIDSPTNITASGNITPVNGKLDGSLSVMRAYSSTALTGSKAATLLRPFNGIQSSISGTVTSGDVLAQRDDTKGSIIVMPNTAVAVTFNGTGTNITGAISVTYEEIELGAVTA